MLLAIYPKNVYSFSMIWTVTSTKRVKNQVSKLPLNIQAALSTLIAEIKMKGPIRGNWSNYSKLSDNKHHCHLKKVALLM